MVTVGVLAATAAMMLHVSVAAAAPHRFSSCAHLRKVFPHGVGRPGAVDHTSRKPVTTFRRDRRWYVLNRGLDRDKDGIACEQA